MRVRVAEHAVLYWDDGRLVWDDYLHQQQFALTEDSSRVLWWFGKWRELRSIERLDAALVPIAERLLEAGLLIAEGSDRHERQNEFKTDGECGGHRPRTTISRLVHGPAAGS